MRAHPERSSRTGNRKRGTALAAPPARRERKRSAVLRVSVAKDRTVKRLLSELISVGARTKQRQVVRLTMRLHSVLVEIGHDV